jgi:2-polyprenyl-3-methyl-5-hydroxy-6-metoxy-1,4-benzoquinol methylase
VSEVARACWCGAADSLEEFGGGYLRCAVCHTLVGQDGLTADETVVRDDEVDFYGRPYWEEHQRKDLDLPDIHVRVRRDMAERCVQWLETLLCYQDPPARVLEVGAGHGAYTALLRWAGFDATAVDLSPWVAAFAQKRFRIPYLIGAIEQQEFDAASFDVVVANDLLEHLDDPFETMRRCVELLRPDGLLVVQTPAYPYPRTYDELQAAGDPFLAHMNLPAKEHLYLFSPEAATIFAERLGVGNLVFEEPPYPYDMVFVANRGARQRRDGWTGVLEDGPSAWPLVLALIDTRDALRRLKEQLAISEDDRRERLEVIERLDKALAESENDRQLRLEVIQHMESEIAELESHPRTRGGWPGRVRRRLYR